MDEVASEPPRRIILIGMMGSGKTTVGRRLANRTGWLYHDNDSRFGAVAARTPRELLAASDEAALLAAEVETLDLLLAEPPPCIVAAAGGTILDPGARRRISAAGFVVWLRVTVATILARAAEAGDRPWRAGDRAAWIERAVVERAPLYASIADLVLDADSAAPDRLVTAIVGLLP